MISLPTLVLLYRRHLRVQPLRELMAVAGIAAGVALLFAVQVADSSITGSFEQIVHGVAGRASLEIAARGPGGFGEGVAEEVARMPDVKASAPVLEQQIVAVGPNGSRALTLVGADERLTALGGKLVSRFERYAQRSRRGLLVLTESTEQAIGASPGGSIALEMGDRTEHVAVAGAVPSDQIGALGESPVAAVSLPVMQVLTGMPGQISRVLIEPRPGRGAALREALARRFGANLNVRPVDSEARLLAGAAKPETQLTALFSAISVAVGIILAYNALLLASGERRRLIVYLIELGTPDQAIVASLLFDAFILGLLGSAIGLLLGDILSLYAYRSAPGYIAAAFPIGAQRVVSLRAILIALGAGMFAAFAAAAVPAIGLLRSSAAQTTDASRSLTLVHKRRTTDVAIFSFGLSLVVVSVTASLIWRPVTPVALVALAVGLVLCLPTIVRYVLMLARAASRASSDPSARLSAAELQSSPTRSVALVATGTIAVFLLVLIGGSIADVQRAVRTGATDTLSGADLWVRAKGPNDVYATQQFSYAAARDRIERLPVVRAVYPGWQAFLDLADRRLWVIGVQPQFPNPIAKSQIVDGDLHGAERRLRQGGWVLLSQLVATEQHLRLGERFTLPTPSGPASFRLAATLYNYGWIQGTALMNGNDYQRLWHAATASELAVVLQPGTPVEEGKQAVERVLPSGSALLVQSTGERRAEVSSVLGGTLARLSDTTTAVLIGAIVSVVALMLAAVWQTRGRLDALLSIGMSTGQLARLVFYEGGLMLLTGCLLGMATGILGQYLVDGWAHGSTGSPVRFDPAWQLGLRTTLAAAAISLAVAVVGALRTARFQAKAAFSTE
jgi:putative ABC transport system permease protein